MNNKIISVLVLIILLFGCVRCTQAGSIWARRDRNMKQLYTDDVARKIGDILTIKITEVSEVDNKAKRDLEKTTDRSATFNGQLNIDHILPKMPGITMTAESDNKLSGKADFKDERSFIDSVTVVVVDIMPNDNLVVLGTRYREIAGDKQTIEISGIVRPSDVSFGNTVDSERVADFRIVTKNAGVSEPFNRPGWLGRIFDILWPL